MKNIHLNLSILFIFISTHIDAQMVMGIGGGYTNSWPGYGEVELPEDAETDVVGYNFNLIFENQISNNLILAFHPGYVRRGAACYPGWQPIFEGDTKVFLNYFECPISISKSIHTKSKKISFEYGFGLSVSYLNTAFTHKETITGNIKWIDKSEISVGFDPDDIFNRYDYGSFASIRLERVLQAKYSVFLSSSIYYGLKDYDKENTSKNRSININTGVLYMVGS